MFSLATPAKFLLMVGNMINIIDLSSDLLLVKSTFKQLLWLRRNKLKMAWFDWIIQPHFTAAVQQKLCVEGFIITLESHSNQKLICVSERGGPAID